MHRLPIPVNSTITSMYGQDRLLLLPSTFLEKQLALNQIMALSTGLAFTRQ